MESIFSIFTQHFHKQTTGLNNSLYFFVLEIENFWKKESNFMVFMTFIMQFNLLFHFYTLFYDIQSIVIIKSIVQKQTTNFKYM